MRLRKEIFQHHTVVFTLVRNPGALDRRLHVLYLLQPPLSPAPFMPLVDYIIDMGRARALPWQRHSVRAVGLFVDFLLAKSAELEHQSYVKVYALFAEALLGGTVDLQGCDPSGLFWEPKKVARAKGLLGAVTAFSDWLENRYSTRPLNPMRQARSPSKLPIGDASTGANPMRYSATRPTVPTTSSVLRLPAQCTLSGKRWRPLRRT